MLASGVVTSASLLGALLGSLTTFLLKDRVGRKAEMFVSATCYGAQLADMQTNAKPRKMLCSCTYHLCMMIRECCSSSWLGCNHSQRSGRLSTEK